MATAIGRKHTILSVSTLLKGILPTYRSIHSQSFSSPPVNRAASALSEFTGANKPVKFTDRPKRPLPPTPVTIFANSRSERFREAAAQRTFEPQAEPTHKFRGKSRQNQDEEERKKLEHLKRIKKLKKKQRETPIIEELTAPVPSRSDLPFAFRYSYTEIPKVKPVGFQEKYSPFGPGRLDRPWDGQECRPVPVRDANAINRPSSRLIDTYNPPSRRVVGNVAPPGPFLPGTGPKKARTREEIIGEPLTKEELNHLLEQSFKTKRQLNIGRDGLTHNMLINFHNYWFRDRVIRVRCKGVSTVDMDNVVAQIEDKTGGKVIHRAGGTVHVFRGRYYNSKDRPNIPMMLWRPHSPLYPKLVVQKPGGLKLQEANALRKRGRQIMPLCRLAKNGFYGDLVQNVREAFQEDDLVRIDCKALNRSDYKKIGAKLRDLVPCVLLSFQGDQILIWKGRPRQTRRRTSRPLLLTEGRPKPLLLTERVSQTHFSGDNTGVTPGANCQPCKVGTTAGTNATLQVITSQSSLTIKELAEDDHLHEHSEESVIVV